MRRLTYLGFVSAVAILTLLSCQKTEKLNATSEDATTKVVVVDPPTDICKTISVNLLAGQNLNVGSVTVSNTAEKLFVTYTTTGDWMISEIHLYVGTVEGLPVNKKGNPQVGHFPTQEVFDPMVNTVTYEFPISNLSDCFIIAAHAMVVNVVDNEVMDTESAWGEGNLIIDKGNWAMYFDYCIGTCP